MIVRNQEWAKRGLDHGTVGVAEASPPNLHILDLVHGDTVLDLRTPDLLHAFLTAQTSPQADAFLTTRAAGAGLLYSIGIDTADCLPIFLWAGQTVGIIHAGWRGLANGIIDKAIKLISGEPKVEIWIGPHAGPERYEVGEEVLEAIGRTAVSQIANRAGKYRLDMARTAQNQLLERGYFFSDCGICTISDERFYSFRRNRTELRNLSYIAPG